MAGADARDGFPCLKHDIWPRHERDIVVAKSASFIHGSLVFVVCGWREETVAGVCQRTYLVHSTYGIFCTRGVKPAVHYIYFFCPPFLCYFHLQRMDAPQN